MKVQIIILMFFIHLSCFGQTKVEQRDPLYQHNYESQLIQENSSIIISKYKSSTINEISLVLKTEAKRCSDGYGIQLTLSDGEVLKFDNLEVNCTPSETRKFNLMGSIILTPELYTKLSKSEKGIINNGISVIKRLAGLITTIKPISNPMKRMVFN